MRGFNRAPRAAGRGRAHHRIAHASHDRLYVREVTIDDAGNGDDVGDSLHALAQDVIGDAERFEEAGILRHGQQLLVRDYDGRVHRLHQLGDTALGLLHAALALEGKRLGDHGDGKRAHFAGQRCDDGSCAGASAAAQTGGDKHHVRAFERFDNLVGVLERRFAADFRAGARAQAIGELDAKLNLHRRARRA